MTTRKERERQARYDLMWTEENEKRWLSSYSINEMQLAGIVAYCLHIQLPVCA